MRCGDVVRCGGQTAQFFLRLDYRIPSAANFLHVANMPSAAARMRAHRQRQVAGRLVLHCRSTSSFENNGPSHVEGRGVLFKDHPEKLMTAQACIHTFRPDLCVRLKASSRYKDRP